MTTADNEKRLQAIVGKITEQTKNNTLAWSSPFSSDYPKRDGSTILIYRAAHSIYACDVRALLDPCLLLQVVQPRLAVRGELVTLVSSRVPGWNTHLTQLFDAVFESVGKPDKVFTEIESALGLDAPPAA